VPGIQFGTVRFNDKPEARYKCGPGWERFTIHLDIAKLNILSSDNLVTDTDSSNSLSSAIKSFSVFNSTRDEIV
jgi:hypothetical protein